MGRRHDEIQGFRPERNLLSPFGKCEYEIIDLGVPAEQRQPGNGPRWRLKDYFSKSSRLGTEPWVAPPSTFR